MSGKKRCSRCGEREGVIDLTHVEGGEVRVDQLCAQCAAEKGIHTAAAAADTPLGGLLAAIGGEAGLAPADPADGAEACPRCGATLQDFRETGHLGCGDCYLAFAEPLRELLRRLHGSTHHTGMAYAPPGAPPPPAEESVEALREQLRRAVEAEAFERAAELRDRLRGRE
jgi:protein arginine kinase activator